MSILTANADLSILKWNAMNCPALGSDQERLSSPALVSQSAGIRRVVAGKNIHAGLGPFRLNWPAPVLSGVQNRQTESDVRPY